MNNTITVKRDLRLKPSYLTLQEREIFCFINNE